MSMAPCALLGNSNLDQLSRDDLCRALFCSMAVYLDNAAAEDLLRKAQEAYPSATFMMVHMSIVLAKALKFLVAYTEDCIFIAFRGADNLIDMASDMKINRERRFGGYFHKGCYDRAESFMGSNRNPLPDLLETSKRIIFCGHSLGGAVAHMVLFRFLLEAGLGINQHFSSEIYPRDSMVSIAFGAPHICDEMAARIINGNDDYKWRFINFVNENDPVPHMLHNLSYTAAAMWRSVLAEADSVLQSLGGFAGRCSEGFADAGFVGALKVVGKETAQLAAKGVEKATRKITSKCHADICLVDCDLSDAVLNPDFHPIGQYIFLFCDITGSHWSASQCFGGDLRIQELFRRDVQYTKSNVEQHMINSYRTVLIAVGFINSPLTGHRGDCSSPQPCQSPRSVVTTPPPKVTFARWKLEDPDSNQRVINVGGENLLFLREAVSVIGSKEQEAWNILKQGDNFLVIYDPHPIDSSKLRPKDSENAILMIIIKTAFGEISHFILPAEEYPNQERMLTGVSRMLLKIAQSLIVKATPPLKIRPDSNGGVMTGLDNIMHCVPSLKRERVSTKITELTTHTVNTTRDLENHIREINFMFKKAVKCLRSCLRVDYESSRLKDLKKLARSPLRGRPGLIIPAVVAGILVLPITMGAAIGIPIFGSKKTTIGEYDLVLQAAILESAEWSESSELLNNSDDGVNCCSIDYLESVLYEKVQGSSPIFQDMVKRAHSLKTRDVPRFKSANFQNATPESRLKLLKRIKMVHDTISLHNKAVAGVHFIGIFGAEDAGKSTFIKRVLERYGSPDAKSPEKLPQTGIRDHAKIAAPYMLNSSLWLVDFPGGNGSEHYADMWKQYTALSTSAILFLDFMGDVKKKQVKMYHEIKENLGAQTKLDVVFNKVDQKFTLRNEEDFTSDYFEDQRGRNQTKLGCDEDAIHFSCVDPDPPERFDKLKKMGVLGFEELMKKVYSGPLN